MTQSYEHYERECEHDYREVEEDDEDEEQQDWGDWGIEDGDEEQVNLDSDILCLFCDSQFELCDALFEHCNSKHHFDFQGIKTTLGLDFYGCFKLINYVRCQVAQNRCWSCGVTCQSNQDLLCHLHESVNFKDNEAQWSDDKYLHPFMQDDRLLYSFDEDGGEYEYTTSEKAELMRYLSSFEKICVNDENDLETCVSQFSTSLDNGMSKVVSATKSDSNKGNAPENAFVNSHVGKEDRGSSARNPKDSQFILSSLKVAENVIKNVNKNYFGSYSSFGIHREMISDQVRTDAYRQAMIKNPSLLNGAVVLDVGCGTGILSLFAAQAGASRVIAVEASEKMAAVATQIARDNGFLLNGSSSEGNNQSAGVIEVLGSMVEDLYENNQIQPHSVDVLVSEWMGYCLLYESMLSSVLFARDRWLKPGGAILPDTATMFVAGFGKGATSIPFWENVYGFNMSCIGKELIEDSARVPIVDVVGSEDVVTKTVVLQSFDLVSMKTEEMDFTSRIELEPKVECCLNSSDSEYRTTWCYGVVVWFENGFTSRFCKEMPTVLSTSPYAPKTHWSQTLLSFHEPILIGSGEFNSDKVEPIGTDACPAARINLRISVCRGAQHRSIDISMETIGIGNDGRKRNWPVQMFHIT